MEYLIGLYNRIGALFCHQLPERTLSIGGMPLPVCARDTGIYLGIFLSTVYLFVRGRFDSDKPPRTFQAVLLSVLMLPMAFDGVSSYLGVRETNNFIRLFTGMSFGLAIPFFLIPAANFKVYGKNSKGVLKNTGELLFLYGVGGLICLAVLEVQWIPWSILSGAIIVGVVFLVSRLVFTVIYRCVPMKKESRFWAVSVLTVSVFIILYFVSSYLLQPLKYLLLKE